MLKIIAGGAIAALILVAAPGVGVAAQTNKAPAVSQPNEQAKTEKATEYSAQRRRYYRNRYRYARPYYRPYAYRPYYARPYYSPYGYYGNPYYRRSPGVYFGFGF
jgi:hypothetical protein